MFHSKDGLVCEIKTKDFGTGKNLNKKFVF